MSAPDGSPSGSIVRKRSVTLHGHATSFSLEDAFFEIIETIAASRGISVSALVAEVDDGRDKRANLSSALRLYALEWVKSGGMAADNQDQTGSCFDGIA